MIQNNVPAENEAAFESPDLEVKERQVWDGAIQLYSLLIDGGKATYKTYMGRARILAMLGRWGDAEADLARVFSENRVVSNNQLDRGVIGKRPELLNAYIEWGFALRNVARTSNDKAKLAKASDIFGAVVPSVPKDSKQWWFARYGQILLLFERGIYDQADVAMSSLERANPGFDGGKYGLNTRFVSLKQEIARKQPAKK